MIDLNKHKYLLTRILKDVYSDIYLANCLGFKGGTALMFFYDLPRFSVDLDFNLICKNDEQRIYEEMREILLKYGDIHDEVRKFYGPIVVLDYGKGERKLKVEISKRPFNDHYEIKNFLGINMKVMTAPDMFAHKLCALVDRHSIANRDIFDCWFFMNRQTPVNKNLIEDRMNMSLADYLQKCIDQLKSMTGKGLLQGMGEMMDENMKSFVRTKLRMETIELLKIYKAYPILSE